MRNKFYPNVWWFDINRDKQPLELIRAVEKCTTNKQKSIVIAKYYKVNKGL